MEKKNALIFKFGASDTLMKDALKMQPWRRCTKMRYGAQGFAQNAKDALKMMEYSSA